MGKLNLPDSMAPEEREKWEEIFALATGTPRTPLDISAVQDGVIDMLASFGSKKAKTQQICRKAERVLAELLDERSAYARSLRGLG